jgi:hypothetical protein
MFASSTKVVHNKHRPPHIRLRLWIKQPDFASLSSNTPKTYQEIGKPDSALSIYFANGIVRIRVAKQIKSGAFGIPQA